MITAILTILLLCLQEQSERTDNPDTHELLVENRNLKIFLEEKQDEIENIQVL